MHVTERLRRLRKRADLSMDQLAKAMGYKGQSSIQRYEDANAFTSLFFPPDFIVRLIPALVGKGEPPITRQEVFDLGQLPGEAEHFREPRPAFPEDLRAVRGLPIYGQALGGTDGEFAVSGDRIGDVAAPPILVNVPDAYAVYVVGESMEPRYFAGEMIYVHPRLPVRRGDFVVVQIQAAEHAPVSGYVKRFVSYGPKELVLEQLNPPEGESTLIRFPIKGVRAVHKIVMSGIG